MDFFTDFAEGQGEDVGDLLDELEAEMAEEDMDQQVPSGKISGGQVHAHSSKAEQLAKEEEDLLAELN